MSDGKKFDLTVFSQAARPTNPLALEEMGNVLLDAMQGTLICLDNQNIIADVSKTIQFYFGFEPMEIVGLSILLLIEASERDEFSKFLNNSARPFDVCSVRMMTATSNEYRQVKVHRKRKINVDSADVHSTTKSNGSVRSILVLTIDDSSYIDINLFDIQKQEFYTKMNLNGEIIFEDHRAAFITGFLPNELISNSIFNFVYHEDRLVKLHALWKCVTTGTSKLQWRFNARNGSIVFLHTEYKLISNHSKTETIVARNELLSPSQQTQFEDLQSAWRHQCTADIRGNGSTFKLISSNDVEQSSSKECRISVPSLNMFFSTSKLQPLTIHGNIFEGSKLVRPLGIQDFIQILIDHDKNLDVELVQIIQNVSTLAARQKLGKNDSTSNERAQIETNGVKKSESESIIRGMLANSVKNEMEKSSSATNSIFSAAAIFPENFHKNSPNASIVAAKNANSNGNETATILTTIPPIQNKQNSSPLTLDSIHQQHNDFMKKYKAAKVKLESQLEMARTQEMINTGNQSDVIKRNTIINKLSQLENIKNKHLSRILELKRQAAQNSSTNNEEKDVLTSLLNSSHNKPISFEQNGTNHQGSMIFNSTNSFFPHSNSTQIQQRISNSNPFENGSRNSIFDEYFSGPQTTNNNFSSMPNGSNSPNSFFNFSYRENSIVAPFNTNLQPNQNQHSSHRSSFPY